MNLDYVSLGWAIAPEAALTLGAILVLAIDLLFLRNRPTDARLPVAVGIAAVSVFAALYFAACNQNGATIFGGVLTLDRLAVASRCGALILTLSVLGFAIASRRTSHPAEYVALLLFATAGVTLMAAARHLLIAFLALELTSLPLYALVAFNTHRRESAEAALKYFLFGGMSAAFLLFGFSLVYGLTGAIELSTIADALAHQAASPLLSLALVMILVALGYKVAAAPFHLWAPDTYQGAPTPVAALIASASKLGGLVMFARLLWPSLVSVATTPPPLQQAAAWLPTVAILSAASLVLGNLAALAQTNVRRLLAYSAIAHAGSLLLGVMITGWVGPAPLFYYAATYGLATAGAFGVLAACEREGRCEEITDLAGLAQRSPLLAGCLLVFVLSLAGIPPLAGFFGKFFVFSAALKIEGLGTAPGMLAVAAILASVVSLYYYLVILKQAWIARLENATPIKVPVVATVTLIAAAAGLVVLGALPSWLLGQV